MPVVPQLMSKSASDFIVMAHKLFDLGYAHVNWNLGCPYPMVAKKGRGAGMLPYPEKVDAFLNRVVPAIPNHLSIKMRLGWRRADEIFDLLPILNRYPLTCLIIHPRTGGQMYTGRPDWIRFSQCLRLSRHQVIYNGDIVTVSDLVQLHSRFPQVDTWMIGRGIVQDPCLPALIKGCAFDDGERFRRFRTFHDQLLASYSDRLCGPSHLLNRMKCLWAYFQNAFDQGREIAKQVRKARSLDQYMCVTNRFFDSSQAWRLTSICQDGHEVENNNEIYRCRKEWVT
jgi:tRNA-dihydrouridine synthase